jgi:uncharacterized protein
MKAWKLVQLVTLCFSLLAVICLAQGEPPLEAERLIKLDPPGQREFVLDRAELISAEHEAQIRELAGKLLTDKAAPLVIVTIHSMADHGGAGMRIETFARLLFDQWEIGPANVGGTTWNRGILLLVSKNDRRARIELGAGWGREQDALCQKIMDEQIVPRFKAGDFSGGILAGAVSLEKMARGLALPKAPTPWWYWPVILGAIALGVFTVVSLIRRGASGWAWLFWGAVFALIGTATYMWLSSMNRRGSGGGFSGGSFGGGGFSGGGGASGSW